MSAINDGGPAFPVTASTGDPRDGVYCQPGMSIRAYFAAKSLGGIRSGMYCHVDNYGNRKLWSSNEAAEFALRDADAMLKAMEVKE